MKRRVPSTKAKPARSRSTTKPKTVTAAATPAAPPSRSATTGERAAAMPWAPDAFGLTRVRAGFGKTPADDVLFALGYPHLVVPTDEPEPKGARDPSKLWKLFPLRHVTHVPRSFLPYAYGYHSYPQDAAELLAGPTTTYDAATEMKTIFRDSDRMMFLLEAMLGSEAVATAAVEFLCKCPKAAWKSRELDEAGWNGIRNLGFVLLRVSPRVRAKLVAKLEALFETITATQGKEWWRPVQALDVMLHGRVGVARSGDDWCDFAHARDDASWAAERALATLKRLKPADRGPFDSQIAFVGGPRVVKAMRNLKPFFAELHRDAKQQLARIA